MTREEAEQRESEAAHRLTLVEYRLIAEAASLVERVRSRTRPTLVNLGELGALVDLRRAAQAAHLETLRVCRQVCPPPEDPTSDLH